MPLSEAEGGEEVVRVLQEGRTHLVRELLRKEGPDVPCRVCESEVPDVRFHTAVVCEKPNECR